MRRPLGIVIFVFLFRRPTSDEDSRLSIQAESRSSPFASPVVTRPSMPIDRYASGGY